MKALIDLQGWLNKTTSKAIIGKEKTERTVRRVSKDSFTVLDFMETFKVLYPEDWRMLIERFGLFGSKRKYTTTTYFSKRLDIYSHERNSLLLPFKRYKEAKFKDYRKTTDEEKKVFGSLWMTVYRRATLSCRDKSLMQE